MSATVVRQPEKMGAGGDGEMAKIADAYIAASAKGLTIEIRLVRTRTFRVRVWLGVKLIALAALLIGCSLDVVSIRSERDLHRDDREELTG